MPTRTGYNVRVQDGKVTDVWDTPAPEGQSGWSEAVEITPDLTPNREILTTHHIDITKNPIEIVWGKRDLTVEERKDSLIGQANFTVTMLENQLQMATNMNNTDRIAELTAEIATATAARDTKVAAVNAATTHEEVDALM
jgi:uncharacterized small protein (DUF1192 family)